MNTLKRKAELQFLAEMVQFVANSATLSGFSQEILNDIKLIAEEIIVNIIGHGYSNNAGDIEISCWLEGENKFITEIVDSGIAFDILKKEDPDLSLGISERPIGGLGILLIKKLADDVEYRRLKEKNILKFVILKSK